MKKLAIALLLAGGMTAAHAAELMLYDIPLQGASRTALKQAVTAAGGRQVGASNEGLDEFDVSRVKGLPGVKKLTAVFFQDTLVMAQYVLPEDSETDEKIRRMLTQKYGNPVTAQSFSNKPNLTGAYIDTGRYTWHFDNKMDLVYKHEFSGPHFLTYLNRTQEAKLTAALKTADDNEARKAASERTRAF